MPGTDELGGHRVVFVACEVAAKKRCGIDVARIRQAVVIDNCAIGNRRIFQYLTGSPSGAEKSFCVENR